MGKPVQHGGAERHSQVLVNLEDFTSLRGDTLIQGIYLVVLGYNLPLLRSSDDRDEIITTRPKNTYQIPINLHSDIEQQLPRNGVPITYKNNVNDFFFSWHTPIMLIQKGRQHQFQDGFCLFHGKVQRQASIYLAALEFNLKPKTPFDLQNFWAGFEIYKENPELVDQMEEAIKAFQEIKHELGGIQVVEAEKTYDEIETRERKIENKYSTVKNRFSRLIKVIEAKTFR